MKNEAFGIIAGGGEIPHYIIRELIKSDQSFCVVSINGLFKKNEFKDHSADVEFNCAEYQIGQVSGIFNFLKANGVTKICLVGRVTKPKFSEVKVDFKGSILLAQMGKQKLLGDDNILRTVIDFVEKQNIQVISALEICDSLVMGDPGNYTNVKIAKSFNEDIAIAKELHESLAKFDIGQSIIIQDKRVLGVEGAEGTDNLIKRCSQYVDINNSAPAILVKLAKKNQDLRVDLPTIGMQTLENLLSNNIKALVIEAKYTLLVNQAEVIKFANKNKIMIYGV